MSTAHTATAHADLTHQTHADSTDVFGFWLYLMTDCVLFASLFAVYVVLHHPGAYGPALKPLIDLHYVLVETFLLLGSNLTFGLAMLFAYQKKSTASATFSDSNFPVRGGFCRDGSCRISSPSPCGLQLAN